MYSIQQTNQEWLVDNYLINHGKLDTIISKTQEPRSSHFLVEGSRDFLFHSDFALTRTRSVRRGKNRWSSGNPAPPADLSDRGAN